MVRTIAIALLTALCAVQADAHETVTIDARDTNLVDVVRLIALQSGQNIVADGSVKDRKVTFRLHDVESDVALAILAQAYGLETYRSRDVVILRALPATGVRNDDGPLAPARQTQLFHLDLARAEDVATILSATMPPGSVAVADKRSSSVIVSASPASLTTARDLIATLDTPESASAAGASAETVVLRNAKASDAIKSLKAALPDTTAVADDRSNAIVVVGKRQAIEAAGAVLERLDQPSRQVLFEVRVTDIKPIDSSSNVGLELGGAGFGTGALAQFPYTLTRSSVTLNAQLNALVQRGHAQILATPRIATVNNREASLLVGESYPVVTVNQQTGYPTVSNVDVGVALRVTPTIGADGVITAELHPSYSAINGFNNSFPIVANRKVDSTVRVRDGETIVLGGLFEETSSETIARLPFLSDIPILGQFFKNKATSHERDEVVFLITPHIVDVALPGAPARPDTK